MVNDLQQNAGVLWRCWRKREMEDCYVSKENWDRRNVSQATWDGIGQWTVSSPSRDKIMSSWNSLPQFPSAPLQQYLTLLHLLPHPLAPPPVPEASRDNNSNLPQSSSGPLGSMWATVRHSIQPCYPATPSTHIHYPPFTAPPRTLTLSSWPSVFLWGKNGYQGPVSLCRISIKKDSPHLLSD